jgi:hypothetical protein
VSSMARIIIEKGLRDLGKGAKSSAIGDPDNNSYIPARKRRGTVHLPLRPIGRIRIIKALSPSLDVD